MKVITIRLNSELHTQLKDLAWRNRTSVNQLVTELITAEIRKFMSVNQSQILKGK